MSRRIEMADKTHIHRLEPQGTISTRQDTGNPVGDDQQMAEESRSAICQRSMGEKSLLRYGAVAHGNRLVRTRMLGGVGRAGVIPALTRFGILISELIHALWEIILCS